ncbi:MAG TPA: WS/DGAT domain-containing protein [Pseudonocardia sp.]|nr:WS/DGAT domain-containing protein [Pseudonocardia sp.]
MSPGPRRPIPPQDGLWLLLDRPTNLLVITSVMWTAEPVDPERLRAGIEERLLGRYPVFRQRPVLHEGAVRTGYWEDDPDFDLDRHLVVRPMPAPGTRAALQRFVGEQLGVPLDRDRPLWTIQLLQGYGSGSAVVQRFHHAIADGIRLTQVMLGILDPLTAGEQEPAARVGTSGPVHDGEHLSVLASSVARGFGGGPLLGAASAVTSLLPRSVRPGRLLDAVAETGTTLLNTAGSTVKIAAWANPRSALSGTPGVEKSAVWGDPAPLPVLAGIARATGTSVGDVCAALVAGAVSRYLAGRGDGDARDLAWMVPVNLEPFDRALPPELGNHFALVIAVLPHEPVGFRDRLAEVHRRLARIRDSYEPALTYALARGIALGPTGVGTRASDLLAAKAVGVLTNVPGPRAPMAIAGARVDGVVGWAPCSGPQVVTACVFSYAGQVTVGFGTDRRVVPDPENLVAAFDAELAAARDAVPVTAPVTPGPPAPRPAGAATRTSSTTRS